MTDSADKRWSMKADRCADSRREALAPVGRMHYCGQTQLSGPNRLSALCHATTLTSHRKSLSLSIPPPLYFIYCIPALKHSKLLQADLLHQLIVEYTQLYIVYFIYTIYNIIYIVYFIYTYIYIYIDNRIKMQGVQEGVEHSLQVRNRRLDILLESRWAAVTRAVLLF